MQTRGDYNTHCDRCCSELDLIKPLNVCNVFVDNHYYAWVLCSECHADLLLFLNRTESSRKKHPPL